MVTQQSKIVEQLRSQRGVDDALSKLQEKSLEADGRRLGEALGKSDWAYGPAEVVATFGTVRQVVARNARGQLVRVPVQESGGSYTLGAPQLFESAIPSSDLAQELLSSARVAAQRILSDDIEGAAPILKTMSKAIDSGGALQRRVNQELNLQSINRKRWYDKVVAESFHDAIALPEAPKDASSLGESLKVGLTRLESAFSHALSDIAGKGAALKGQSVTPETRRLARDVIEDIKHAVSALHEADRTDEDEMLRVYECSMNAAPRLLAAAQFLGRALTHEAASL